MEQRRRYDVYDFGELIYSGLASSQVEDAIGIDSTYVWGYTVQGVRYGRRFTLTFHGEKPMTDASYRPEADWKHAYMDEWDKTVAHLRKRIVWVTSGGRKIRVKSRV